MARYTASHAVSIHNTVELAAAGLEALIHAIDSGKNNMSSGIVRIEANKYAAWVVYTAEA